MRRIARELNTETPIEYKLGYMRSNRRQSPAKVI